jgi:hypothetical protein
MNERKKERKKARKRGGEREKERNQNLPVCVGEGTLTTNHSQEIHQRSYSL